MLNNTKRRCIYRKFPDTLQKQLDLYKAIQSEGLHPSATNTMLEGVEVAV